MAQKNISEQEALRQEKLNETVSKTEQFLHENKKTILGTIGAVAAIVVFVLGYNQFIAKPAQAEAMAQMFPAEASFQAEAYEVALNGDGNVLGFKDIIDQYGSKAGKAVYMYAGLCELNLGNFQEAISYLKKYEGKDAILTARALGSIADAYVGLEDYKSAVDYFAKAVAAADNVFAAGYLLKEGVVYEELGNDAKALECYKQIKEHYPQSLEGYDIDKYISRIETK